MLAKILTACKAVKRRNLGVNVQNVPVRSGYIVAPSKRPLEKFMRLAICEWGSNPLTPTSLSTAATERTLSGKTGAGERFIPPAPRCQSSSTF
jgi:hypothetical protein